jgi:hypothetical protein
VKALSKKNSPNIPKTLGESQMPATHYLETRGTGSEKAANHSLGQNAGPKVV